MPDNQVEVKIRLDDLVLLWTLVTSFSKYCLFEYAYNEQNFTRQFDNNSLAATYETNLDVKYTFKFQFCIILS